MPDITPPLNQDLKSPNLPPPSGDPDQAEKYIVQLVQLIETDKLDVTHTDLSKLDPSALQDHYLIELQEYQIEVSHSKYPNTGKDSYVILFTNIKKVTEGSMKKIILAYMHLTEDQYSRFRKVSLEQIEKRIKAEQERRLKEALMPIDQAFENLSHKTEDLNYSNKQVPDGEFSPDLQTENSNTNSQPQFAQA